jgi:putative transposase
VRYAAAEKLEIIRLVESSHLGVKRMLDKLGAARPTFYRWYARYLARGEAGLNNGYRGPARP